MSVCVHIVLEAKTQNASWKTNHLNGNRDKKEERSSTRIGVSYSRVKTEDHAAQPSKEGRPRSVYRATPLSPTSSRRRRGSATNLIYSDRRLFITSGPADLTQTLVLVASTASHWREDIGHEAGASFNTRPLFVSFNLFLPGHFGGSTFEVKAAIYPAYLCGCRKEKKKTKVKERQAYFTARFFFCPVSLIFCSPVLNLITEACELPGNCHCRRLLVFLLFKFLRFGSLGEEYAALVRLTTLFLICELFEGRRSKGRCSVQRFCSVTSL